MTLEMANRLTSLRKAKGLSQEELADKLGISRQAISKWERAEASPDTDNLITLSKLYGVTLDELIGVSPVREPDQASAQNAAQASDPDDLDDPIDPDNPLPHGSFYDHLEQLKHNRYPYPVIVSFLYLVLGFVFHLWHPGWIIFLTIPLYYLPATQRTPLRLLGNPIMVTIIYLLLGCYCNLWHPGWLIFFAIPLLGAATRD